MNWDWEKLQEKRQRQPGVKKPQQQGQGTPPPNFPNFGEKFKNFKPISFPVKFLVIIPLVLWGLSGIFIISPDEEGVILRFGKYDRTVAPGPHIRLPFPIESHLKPKVTQVQRIEVGFRSPPNVSSVQSQVLSVPEEASMLTSDENIVTVQFIIQYRIADSRKFLFNLARQHETVKSAGEAAMREAIGKSRIDAALTEGKVDIQTETQQLLQSILERYDAGISVLAVQMQDVHVPNEVMSAFRDVASAREDKVRSTNLADAYRNQLIPEAQGMAAQIVNEAEAYRETSIRRAQGEGERFLAVLAEYNKARDVTKKRMYIETMESILSDTGIEKIILPKETGSNTLPILPLGSALQGATPAPSAKLPEAPRTGGGKQ
jgi:membrane protease subunit HflK